jgi:hypothetical protein
MTRDVIAREMQTQIARLPRYDAKVRGLLPYTSAAKRALEAAMDEASELGDDYVEQGMCCWESCVTAKALPQRS